MKRRKSLMEDTLLIAIIFSAPIWIIPYLLYHYREIREEII